MLKLVGHGVVLETEGTLQLVGAVVAQRLVAWRLTACIREQRLGKLRLRLLLVVCCCAH